MKYINGNYYVEIKDKTYLIHPTENIFLCKRDPTKSLRTQYQIQNETQIRKRQKVIRNNNNEMMVEKYPKNKQPIQVQQKIKPPISPSCN